MAIKPVISDDVNNIRKRVIEVIKNVNESNWELCKLLHIIYDKGYFKDWGYSSFEEYLEKELDISRRKGYYLVNIWDWFVVKGNVDNPDKVKRLGWSKAKELVGIINKENQNEWLEKALKTSVRDLVKEVDNYIKTTKQEISSNVAISVENIKRVFFMLYQEQYDNLMQALEIAQLISGSDKQGHNLDLICTEFLSTHQVFKGTSRINNLKKFFVSLERIIKNIKIIVLDTEKNEVILGEEILKR